jgi:hypothetical protein
MSAVEIDSPWIREETSQCSLSCHGQVVQTIAQDPIKIIFKFTAKSGKTCTYLKKKSSPYFS